MGFWHTGYEEFHEPTGLGEWVYTAPPPVRYVCAHCLKQFAQMDDLRHHRFNEHPLRQPALLLRGRDVGTLPLVVLTPLEPDDVVIEDATRCLVNGRMLKPNEVGTHLASMTREVVDMELTNGEVSTRCVLDFRLAEEAHLAGVEAAFLRLARERVLNINAISGFIEDCRSFDSAMPYYDGICHYLYGVMAKEQAPDSGLKPGQYTERYMRASEGLKGFNRPLAQSVQALVAFHFNQFDEAELLAPDGVLRHASGAFAGLLQGLPWHFESAFAAVLGGTVENLLTDQQTLQILSDASQGLVDMKDRTEELQARLHRVPVGYDKLKYTLLASEALAAREDSASRIAARRLARELAGQPDTNLWAEAMLERLKIL